MMRERGGPISGQSGSDLQTSGIHVPESTGILHSGLQEFFIQRDAVPQAPGIDQLELIPWLRLVFEQPAQGSNQSPRQLEREDHQGPYRVLGAVCSRAEVRSAFSINGINLAVSFMPWGDDAIVYNQSSMGLVLASAPEEFNVLEIGPSDCAIIYPGTWELRGNNNTALQFRLRPRRYSLFLEKKSNKRAAGQDLSSLESVRFSRGRRQFPQRWYDDSSPRIVNPDRSPFQNSKVVTRPVTTEGADVLFRVGLDEDSTLSVIDEMTGRLEYSITRDKGRIMKRSAGVDVYKALFKPGLGSSQPQVVIVKMHKHGDSLELAMRHWRREHSIHRGLRHVSGERSLLFPRMRLTRQSGC